MTLAASALLFLLFAKTKIGLAMRAVASNPESSKLVGVPTRLVLAGSWGLSGALAALAGVMVAGAQAQVTPTMMFTIFVYASAAATLGGLDSPIGAVVGGLSIGVVENLAAEFAPGWVGQEMKLSVALLCIFVVLFVKPSGLFGTEQVRTRVHGSDDAAEGALGLGRAHWAIRLLWVAATIALIVYIPTRSQPSTISDMTTALELASVAMALNLVMGFGGLDLPRTLALLRARRLHDGRARRPLRVDAGMDAVHRGGRRLRRRLPDVATRPPAQGCLPRPHLDRLGRVVPAVRQVAEAGMAHRRGAGASTTCSTTTSRSGRSSASSTADAAGPCGCIGSP